MPSEPQVEGPPKTIYDLYTAKRQWTRNQARIYVGFTVFSLVGFLFHTYTLLFHPTPFVSFTWWLEVNFVSYLLGYFVSCIRNEEAPLLPALRKDHVDPVYPEEETRFLRRTQRVAIAMISTCVIAWYVFVFCTICYYRSSRTSDDLQHLLWPVGGVFTFGTMVIIRCRAVGKRIRADWEAYVALRDNEKAEA